VLTLLKGQCYIQEHSSLTVTALVVFYNHINRRYLWIWGYYCFQFFVRTFREIMSNDKASAKELSLAMKGYGLLATVSV